MNSYFESYISSLKERLQHPLPGELAQDKMMPVGRSARQRKILEDQQQDIRMGGVLILLFPDNDRIYFPLTLRHEYPGVHAGQISLPGGRMEEQDDDLIMTAVRETEEEIGVSVNDINIIGTLSQLYIPPSRYKITPAVGYVPRRPEFKLDAREVKELILADVNHLTDLQFRKRKNLMVRDTYELDTPYFDIHGQVVWGATGMILSEFAHIIEELG